MSTEEEVLQASEQFYAALDRFLNGDSEPMMGVWSHGPDVTEGGNWLAGEWRIRLHDCSFWGWRS